ncbi:MAG TPA: thioredoxin domain-containing protein [Vicinamibacterales bacterium]|nr:thioredoxin domain-containing protein [Vicinamibacterales bacterium]
MRVSLGLVLVVSVVLAMSCGGSSGGSKTATTGVNACGAAATAAASCSGAGGVTSTGTRPPFTSLVNTIPQNGQTLGSASAPLKIDLYQNFLCAHCRDFALDVFPQIIGEYVAGGRVMITFHDTALGGGPADIAHEAGRCAADQGKFWDAYFALYQNYSDDAATYTKARMESALTPTGVDIGKLSACLDSNQHQAEVDASTNEFMHLGDSSASYASANATVQAGGGPGIPVLNIGGTYLIAPPDYATVKAAIDAKLAP